MTCTCGVHVSTKAIVGLPRSLWLPYCTTHHFASQDVLHDSAARPPVLRVVCTLLLLPTLLQTRRHSVAE